MHYIRLAIASFAFCCVNDTYIKALEPQESKPVDGFGKAYAIKRFWESAYANDLPSLGRPMKCEAVSENQTFVELRLLYEKTEIGFFRCYSNGILKRKTWDSSGKESWIEIK